MNDLWLCKINTLKRITMGPDEITEDQINSMTPNTLKTELLELREQQKLKEEEAQRQELRDLVAGRSVDNSQSVGISSTRLMVDQRIQKPPNLEECSSEIAAMFQPTQTCLETR